LDNPYLHGVYAPTLNEMHVDNLPVTGQLPADLQVGAYFRNGPNPRLQPRDRHHPFDGDGMVHAVYFRDGKASYRNRYVQTAALQRELAAGASNSPGVMGPFDYTCVALRHQGYGKHRCVWYAGELIALWYNAGDPYRLDGMTLQTRDFHLQLRGRPQTRMSAHAKVDATNGELLFFDYGDEPPYMTYGVADAGGNLLHEVAIDLPGPRLPHDIGFTRHYAVVHDLPFFHDVNVLRKHGLPCTDLSSRYTHAIRHHSTSRGRARMCGGSNASPVTSCT
jgi:carotenoid cleavage dioxygenase-like enzyme